MVQEDVAVPLVTDDGEEDLADGERARVDRHPRDGHAEVTAHEGALGAAHHVLDREDRHRAGYDGRSSSTARASARSSKGSTSVPMIW